MTKAFSTPLINANGVKKNFYITEILMLKSIVVLLVLTFFLLNEMQASNRETNQLRDDIFNKKTEMESDIVLR